MCNYAATIRSNDDDDALSYAATTSSVPVPAKRVKYALGSEFLYREVVKFGVFAHPTRLIETA